MSRIVIIANRLPVKVNRQKDGSLEVHPSEGGLATGLSSLSKENEIIWVGWPGLIPQNEAEKEAITQKLAERNAIPIFLSEQELHDYYEGFSNKTLWPLFHYFINYAEYDKGYWETYQKVNQRFAEKALEHIHPEDRIWVNDYQLMLVPNLLRKALPESTIGFFLHIPFPSYEVFRTLIWRSELLEGVLGADLVGFHTFEYMRHFASAVYRILGVEENLGKLYKDDRCIHVDSFPMGIDEEKFANATKNPEIQEEAKAYRSRFGGYKLILSIDRLDYSKGIVQRLKAFDQFLETYPEQEGKVSLVIVVVPSRPGVERYQNLKEEIDEWVGRINGKYGAIDWVPVHYFYRSLPFSSLTALYNIADIALVTPFRDGMNLIAKEYLATKGETEGVLILSEMAGAFYELGEALIINPNNIDEIVEALNEAIHMPKEQQLRSNRKMQEKIRRYNVHRWAKAFMDKLEDSRQMRLHLWEKEISEEEVQALTQGYQDHSNRLLLLDYDGTLTAFHQDHDQPPPRKEVYSTLNTLYEDPDNRVVVISGRDKKTLENWFQDPPVDLAAEHGALMKEGKGEWVLIHSISQDWKKEIHTILEEFVDRTPGSYIEEKEYSLVWHYRKIDAWIADIRIHELMNSLIHPATQMNLEVLEGDKIIEVKQAGTNKGDIAKKWIDKIQPDFILCIGNDTTDEDMFRKLPYRAWTLKVGSGETYAKFTIRNPQQVLKLLKRIGQGVERKIH